MSFETVAPQLPLSSSHNVRLPPPLYNVLALLPAEAYSLLSRDSAVPVQKVERAIGQFARAGVVPLLGRQLEQFSVD